jgi:hypothetical protein
MLKKIVLMLLIIILFSSSNIAQKQLAFERHFSNPLLIYGTSFGNFFQTLYKQAKFQDMVRFTAIESLTLFGKRRVENYYKETFFGYEMKLRSYTYVNGVYTLNYESIIQATLCVVRLNVIIENDSSKVLLTEDIFNQKIFLIK